MTTSSLNDTRKKYPLDPKKIIKKTLEASSGWFGLFIVIYGFWAIFLKDFVSLHILAVGLLLFLLIVLTYLYQQWYFNYYFYDFTADYVVIRKNPLTPREITIPYERIQDVYMDQDILDRLFGLYDVHLSSATISSALEAHIDGVGKKAAEELRYLLMQKLSIKNKENKSPG